MNQNNPNQPIIDFIRSYLHNEYKDDLRFIFQLDYENERGRCPWLRLPNVADAKTKSNIRAVTDPMRHFVFSSIFLYQIMVHITSWGDDVRFINFVGNNNYNGLLDRLEMPDFGLDIVKEYNGCFLRKKLDGLKALLNRYGLMTTFINDGYHRFLLACIFDVLQRMLQDELSCLDISGEECDHFIGCVNKRSRKILNALCK